MSVPATRLLPAVLRDALTQEQPLKLVIAIGGAVITGAAGNAYVNVVIGGQTVKVPKLRQATSPPVGGVAYLLQSNDLLLYIGTVTTT